jgi:hypothetical protein
MVVTRLKIKNNGGVGLWFLNKMNDSADGWNITQRTSTKDCLRYFKAYAARAEAGTW